jgi:hypothetical protein
MRFNFRAQSGVSQVTEGTRLAAVFFAGLENPKVQEKAAAIRRWSIYFRRLRLRPSSKVHVRASLAFVLA